MRVGLRSLPFRKAPYIPSYVAGESVFPFDTPMPGVGGGGQPTDERVFTFDGGDPKVFGEAVQADEKVWTFAEGDGGVEDPGALTTVQLTIDVSTLRCDTYYRYTNAVMVDRYGSRFPLPSGRKIGEPIGPGQLTHPTTYGELAPGETFLVVPEWDDPMTSYPALNPLLWDRIPGTPTSDPVVQTAVRNVRHYSGVTVARPVVRLQRRYAGIPGEARLRVTSPLIEQMYGAWMKGNPFLAPDTGTLVATLTEAARNAASMLLGIEHQEGEPPPWGMYQPLPPIGVCAADASASRVGSDTWMSVDLWKHPTIFHTGGVSAYATLTAMGHSTRLYPSLLSGTPAQASAHVSEIESFFNSYQDILNAGGVHFRVLEGYPDGGFKIKYR